ncbi:MAG: hypothetical protein KDA79_05180 [Planctomycetaceae bacterium]|nr:hypothetical protein [Planctomycetaceae bacterium]
MNDASQSTRTSAGSKSTVLLLGIVVLPVLYVLSIGPFNWMYTKGWLGPWDGPLNQTLLIPYYPLVICTRYKIPVVAPALEWYLSLWTG